MHSSGPDWPNSHTLKLLLLRSSCYSQNNTLTMRRTDINTISTVSASRHTTPTMQLCPRSTATCSAGRRAPERTSSALEAHPHPQRRQRSPDLVIKLRPGCHHRRWSRRPACCWHCGAHGRSHARRLYRPCRPCRPCPCPCSPCPWHPCRYLRLQRFQPSCLGLRRGGVQQRVCSSVCAAAPSADRTRPPTEHVYRYST